MISNLTDTIAAVSTPYGRGGVAMIRVSGPDAVALCSRCFFTRDGKQLCDFAARTAVYGTIRETEEPRARIDDGIAVVYRAPASYTGEDTVELTCHGGVIVTEKVLSAVLCAGARIAEAGEFTRRAFLNGKISLTEAEAVGGLIDAQTDSQACVFGGSGVEKLKRETDECYDALKGLLASLFARIDFPDEELSDIPRPELTASLDRVGRKLSALADTYDTGRAIADGIVAVICGCVNAGKSSVFNRLTGRDAAIVTDIAGTTRDVLESTVRLGRLTLRLFDTAGLRDSSDAVEKIGVERAKKSLETAELILAVFDSSRPSDMDRDEKKLADMLAGRTGRVVILLNKSDIAADDTRKKDALVKMFGKENVFSVCALDGAGFDILSKTLEERFTDTSLRIGDDAMLTNARQYASVVRARDSVKDAHDAAASGMPEDVVSVGCEDAMKALASLSGRVADEDVVNEIFSHFCVGK